MTQWRKFLSAIAEIPLGVWMRVAEWISALARRFMQDPKKSNTINAKDAFLCCVRARNNASRFVSDYADLIRDLNAEIPLQAGVNPVPFLTRVLPSIFGGRTILQQSFKSGELLELFMQSEARIVALNAANLELKLIAGTGVITSLSATVQNMTDNELQVLQTHCRIMADAIRQTSIYDCGDCIHRRTQGQDSIRKYFHGKQIRTLGPPGK